MRSPGPFNFSALNNFAVEQTQSPWLLFLNNDIEVIDGDWLNVMAEHVQRPEVGAVGARLLYPDERCNMPEWLSVSVALRSMRSAVFRRTIPVFVVNCRSRAITAAVTAACLLTRREVFEEVGGFDEERLPVTLQ